MLGKKVGKAGGAESSFASILLLPLRACPESRWRHNPAQAVVRSDGGSALP